ncbi:hypothetical protein C5167_036437, partial [Papaver somniferum]
HIHSNRRRVETLHHKLKITTKYRSSDLEKKSNLERFRRLRLTSIHDANELNRSYWLTKEDEEKVLNLSCLLSAEYLGTRKLNGKDITVYPAIQMRSLLQIKPTR